MVWSLSYDEILGPGFGCLLYAGCLVVAVVGWLLVVFCFCCCRWLCLWSLVVVVVVCCLAAHLVEVTLGSHRSWNLGWHMVAGGNRDPEI